MTILRQFLSGFRVHLIPEEQELFIKMPGRVLKGSPMFPAIRKCPGNPHSPHGIQPVRILDNLSLRSFRPAAPVMAEGDAVYDTADFLNPLFLHSLCTKEGAAIGIIPGIKELWIISIVQKGGQSNHFAVTIRLPVCNGHRHPVNPHGMGQIMTSRLFLKEFPDIRNGRILESIHCPLLPTVWFVEERNLAVRLVRAMHSAHRKMPDTSPKAASSLAITGAEIPCPR